MDIMTKKDLCLCSPSIGNMWEPMQIMTFSLTGLTQHDVQLYSEIIIIIINLVTTQKKLNQL